MVISEGKWWELHSCAPPRPSLVTRPFRTDKRKKFVSLPFLPELIPQLGEVLTINMTPISYPYFKTGILFSWGEASTRPSPCQGAVCLLLSCWNCPAVYIGSSLVSMSTGQHLRIPILQNRRSLNISSITIGHVLEKEEILHFEDKYRRRLALENIENILFGMGKR